MHQFGNSGSSPRSANGRAIGQRRTPDFSHLWNFNGMNVFHGKVVGIKDGQFGPWTPGVAVGGVVRTGDKFVTGEAGLMP